MTHEQRQDLQNQARQYAGVLMNSNELLDLLAEAERMRGVLSGVRDLARDGFNHWEADEDHKAGKILSALAGYMTNYHPSATALHEALTTPDQGERT